MLDKPVVSQALATVQEGKGVMAGLFWGVSHTLPSAVRTAAVHGDKVHFRHSGFIHV